MFIWGSRIRCNVMLLHGLIEKGVYWDTCTLYGWFHGFLKILICVYLYGIYYLGVHDLFLLDFYLLYFGVLWLLHLLCDSSWYQISTLIWLRSWHASGENPYLPWVRWKCWRCARLQRIFLALVRQPRVSTLLIFLRQQYERQITKIKF